MVLEVENFIDGEFCPCAAMLDSFDPSTGGVWARIPNTPAAEVDRAVQAAKRAFPGWSSTSEKDRSVILHRVADLLEQRLEEFAVAESRDQGKPVWLARAVDIPRAVYNFKFFASAILHHTDLSQYQPEFQALNYTSRMPVGVCGLISPWNLPLYLLTFKLGPALATGNTVVCKPSEMTSVTAYMLATVCKEAGLPAGVLNITFGNGPVTGDAIIRHPEVPVISFTGSTATAEKIRYACAPLTKKLSLELGGKNAGIIFADCNLDKCVDVTTRSSFINQGEICLCTSRLFVQRQIYDIFLEKFITAARGMKVGCPTDPNNKLGALISKEHLQKVTSYVQIARDINATVRCGHGVDELLLPDQYKDGYYFQPTILTDLADDSRPMQEEIFGPVVCVVPFDTEDEVISRVNNNQYGLCATVWTKDVNVMHRVERKLQVGTVWGNCWLVRNLNMPFGGMKASGIGREGKDDSIDFFTEVKTVCLQLD